MKNLYLCIVALILLHYSITAQDAFLIDTISTISGEQFNPAITSGGTKYMVFWEDEWDGNIHGAVINSQGMVKSKTEIWNSNHRSEPAIAFDGNTYFLAYYVPDWWTVATLAYDSNGVIVYPFEIYHYGVDVQGEPEIIFGNSNYLVIWPCDSDGRYSGLEGRMLSLNGTMGDLIWFSRHPRPAHISVAFGAEHYFVAFEVYGDIYGIRIDTSGVPIDSARINISVKPTIEQMSEIAFDGTNYLVVWQDDRNGNDFDIYGARVTPSGEVLDTLGFPVSIADSNQVNPEITFDGENYIVVWEDYRNGQEADIYGAKVNTDGNVVDSLLISNQGGEQKEPDLCKGSGNQVLVVYSGWTSEYQGKTYNSMKIWGKMLGEPSDVNEDENDFIATDFELEQNYPNPFNPSTKIRYSVPQTSSVVIKVFDILGNEIETLVNEEKEQGVYTITFDANNLASGMYLYRIQAGSFIETKKMILLK